MLICSDLQVGVEHTDIIRKNYRFLLEQLDPVNSGLVDALYSRVVLSHREKEEIESQSTPTTKSEKLLSIICRKAHKKFDIFLDILDSTNQTHVAGKLRGQRLNCINKLHRKYIPLNCDLLVLFVY